MTQPINTQKDNVDKLPPEADKNAGSGAFNQGVQQDPDYDKGTPVSDEEKLTGHLPHPGKEKENPKDGNIGKNNAGGYE